MAPIVIAAIAILFVVIFVQGFRGSPADKLLERAAELCREG